MNFVVGAVSSQNHSRFLEKINLVFLELNFVSLEINLAPLEINFASLEINFAPLEINFASLEINFTSLEINFAPLEINFAPLEIKDICVCNYKFIKQAQKSPFVWQTKGLCIKYTGIVYF